jgi:hypothetical protein
MDAADLVTETMLRVTANGFNPHTSPWPHKVCVMMHAAQGIIDNGGFEYFFSVPFDGDPDPEDFSKVFAATGADESASAIREAMVRSNSTESMFEDLNALLWRESDRNYELLAEFILTHAASYA